MSSNFRRGIHKKKLSAWSRTKLSRVPRTKVEGIIMQQQNSRTIKKGELKYLDTLSTGIFNTTGSTVLLNGVAEGLENNQRVGRQCMIKSVYVKGLFQNNGAFSADDLGEIRIFWHKDPLGSTPATGSWFQGGNISSLALNNVDNEDTVICLATIKCTTEVNGTSVEYQRSVDGQNTGLIERYIKINELSRWNNTTAIAPVAGGLFVVFVGSGAAVNGPGSFNCTFRIRYRDM